MKQFSLMFCLVILSGLWTSDSAIAQTHKGMAELVGKWSGESICVNKEKFPACNDEQVIYRVVKASAGANVFTITMDKIVNGKPETMGVLDFIYDAEKQALSCEFRRNRGTGLFELAVNGDLMDGTLITLPDKTLVRHIKVKKDK